MSLELLERASAPLLVELTRPFIGELSALGLDLLRASAESSQGQLVQKEQEHAR